LSITRKLEGIGKSILLYNIKSRDHDWP
jgi:hypothetical protein